MEVPDPAVRRVRAVLDLDPVSTSAGAIGAIEVLRYNAFKTHIAGDMEIEPRRYRHARTPQ
jgi:hypothetical protein